MDSKTTHFKLGPGIGAHAYNPNTLEVGNRLRSGVQEQPGQQSETTSLQKIKKRNSHAWWCVPVVQAIQKGEVE